MFSGMQTSKFLFKYRRACYYDTRDWRKANFYTRLVIADIRDAMKRVEDEGQVWLI